MFNYLIKGYPKEIEIDGTNFSIDTDFRTWIGINEAMLDISLDPNVRAYLIMSVFKKSIPRLETTSLKKVANFLKGPNQEDSKESAHRKSRYIFSFTYDADYIIGAFQECYGIDLINIDYLHWWHFLALLNALNIQCALKQRMYYRSIRLADIKDKKERNRIRKIQNAIALPSIELSDEAIANAFT